MFTKVFLVFFLLGAVAFAEDTLWTRTYGDTNNERGCDIQQTFDGGYIIVGEKSDGPFNSKVLLIKTDPNGDTLWTNTHSREGLNVGYTVHQNPDSGYIIGGYNPRDGGFLIKTDKNGESLWRKTYEVDAVYSVQQTFDSSYIVAGWKAVGLIDSLLLIKTDMDGNLLWRKAYWGGTLYERSCYIQQTSDSGFIVVAFTSLTPNPHDVWLLKTDREGNLLWTKTYGGQDDDRGYAVQPTNDSGYIIVGQTRSFGAGNYDVWIIKTDANGETLWTKTYGGPYYDRGWSIQQTSGGYIIVGFKNGSTGNGDILAIKIDTNGDTVWTRTYGGPRDDWGWTIRETSDGGFIIVGQTYSFGSGGSDVYLLKITSSPGIKEVLLPISRNRESIPSTHSTYNVLGQRAFPDKTGIYFQPSTKKKTIRVK